jgi:hypothetical protein
MEAVRADLTASLTPKGYSVIQAVFLAPVSIEARDLAESKLGGMDVPIEFEE